MNDTKGWKYIPTDEELYHAELLRAQGWKVVPPQCPECNGFGHKWLIAKEGEYSLGTSPFSTIPCPNGCETPGFYYFTSALTGI